MSYCPASEHSDPGMREAHAANSRCQRVVIAVDLAACELERDGHCEAAARLRKKVSDVLKGAQ